MITPLLPVRQDRASLDWPQAQAVQVTAPLVDYVPLALDASLPCTALRDLAGGTVLSTVPVQAPGATAQGLVAKVEDTPGTGRTLSVMLRGTPLLTASIFEITGVGTASDPADGTVPGNTPPANTPSGTTTEPAPGANPSTGQTPAPGMNPGAGTTPAPGSTPLAGPNPGQNSGAAPVQSGAAQPSSAPRPGTGPAPGSTPLPGSTPPPGSTPAPGATPPADPPRPPANGAQPDLNTAIGPGSGVAKAPSPAPAGGCSALVVHSTSASTTVELTGLKRADGSAFRATVDKDVRPQVVGVYTDLDRAALGDAHLHAAIDSRFSSSPSALKLAAVAGAVLCTLVALICLHLIDSGDGRRSRRFLPARWWRFTGADALVLLTMACWHVFGANTSDDGYILTMARVSRHAGYTANYYRWFGVAEAPFGWPYEVLAQMTRVADSGVWMRVPALLAGLLCWWVISREVLPRLGSRVRASAVARWTAALALLAMWLPYDNGLRPEPLIALGALLTWCSIERAIATRRLLPAAVAVLVAAFSLAAGPSGLICLAALFAGSRRVLQTLVTRTRAESTARARRVLGYCARIAPVAAAGTLVLVVVFADQTLASVLEATRVRKLVGPDYSWPDEPVRWAALLHVTPDGSLSRRFGVLAMLLCLAVCVVIALRKGGRIPETARGPVARLLAVVAMSQVLMAFTPTKWTHHFGVYAGLAAALAAVTTVAVSRIGIRARHYRTLFAAAVLALVAYCFTGSNGWWYVSGYGVAWPNLAPTVGGVQVSTALFGLACVCLAVAAWQYFREPYRAGKPSATGILGRFSVRPLTVAAAALVAFEVATLGIAAYSQYPAYSVGLSNLRALQGKPCALADDVLVETDTADSLLTPYTGTAADGLSADASGFTANGVGDLTPEGPGGPGGGSGGGRKQPGPPPGGTADKPKAKAGINGSTVALPFGLDPERTPVLGSYATGPSQSAHLTTQWYRLDAAARRDPAHQVLVLTVAGRIAGEADGHRVDGARLRLEFAHRADDGTVTPLGGLVPPGLGGAPGWRDLPVALDRIPEQANAIRLVAAADDPTGQQWLAVVPPRLPALATLNTVVGRDTPVLTDFHVGLAFPCQHPFDHQDGVAQIPGWRIQPDKLNAQVAQTWQGEDGGGPLGWIDLTLRSQVVPAYLDHDWTRDWGELDRLTPYVDLPAANLDVRVENRWGWSKDAPIRVDASSGRQP